MRNDRDYRQYKKETTVIDSFEQYEKEIGMDFGSEREDFMMWFLCFREGFIKGGDN